MRSREGRIRLFLAFLVLVLVLVNSQSLQLSSSSRALLTSSFDESFESRARLVAGELLRSASPEELGAANDLLELQARAQGLRSACILDWNSQLLTGGGCEPAAGDAFDRLDRDGRRRLLEEGWATTGVTSPYDPDAAEATGYFALRASAGQGDSFGVLRVVTAASALAEANIRFRATLVYQVSALSLVLVAVVLFVKSLLTPHRRLVAEARSVATEFSGESFESRDEGQFLLETFQDVVARLKAKEEELKALHRLEKARADETEALATDIIHSMTTGLVSLDRTGGVALVNPSAEKIFGVEAARARGRPFPEVFAGSPELGRMVEEALVAGTYHLRGRARYRVEGGPTLHLGVSVIPLLSAQGAPRGALCLLADLTEVVELRERLFLKENLARLGEMAAGIAHEFRNGLATIMGNAKLLKNPDAGAESDEIVEALFAESQSLARVVSEFLQFARPEPLHPEPVDLDHLVAGLMEELRPRASAAGIDLLVEGGGIRLEGDEMLLRKAFTNLVTNAIDALTEARTENGRVVVELLREESAALVRVRDNGPGVAAEHRDKLFTPFFTLKETGTGLGLSVVQKVVVSHNGSVELEETRHGGASFAVRLPLAGPDASQAPDWI